MSKRDYYDVLNVSRDADDKEIKNAFRRLAKKYHPDANPGDTEAEAKFKEINEAYEVLKDPQKKSAYDRFGHGAFEGGMGSEGGHGFGADFSSSMSDIFNDLFGEFVGGRRSSRTHGERGSDLRYDLSITLEDSYSGKDIKIKIPTSVSCNGCNGSGAKPGTKHDTCLTCGGNGVVRTSQGFFTIERTCHVCGGAGETITDPCNKCSGRGRVATEKALSVNIPAGIEDGTRIRLAGEGEAGAHGGSNGDLYVFISIKSHEFFYRDSKDLFCVVPVSMTTAALGGQIKVPSIDGGDNMVNVPEGTQNGTKLRLKGKGMPLIRSRQYGDLYIQINVETPVKLSKKQKQLLKDFEEESDSKNHPETTGFFTKVKEFLEKLGE